MQKGENKAMIKNDLKIIYDCFNSFCAKCDHLLCTIQSQTPCASHLVSSCKAGQLSMVKAAKDKRDIYYRLAKENGFRARSAYKLLQIDEAYGLFGPTTRRVVDLCAAPGSWSQVVLQKFQHLAEQDITPRSPSHRIDATTTAQEALLAIQQHDLEARHAQSEPLLDPVLVSVDLQPMAPLDSRCVMLQADITSPATLKRIVAAFEKAAGSLTSCMAASSLHDEHISQHKADLVISDGAPDVTGMHDLDIYLQHQLLLSALSLATCVLRDGGAFVAKIFKKHDDFSASMQNGVHGLSNHNSGDNAATLLLAQAHLFFKRVSIYKPASSRASSLEHFLVCEDYCPPDDFVPSLERPLSLPNSAFAITGQSTNGQFADFMALGDLSMYNVKTEPLVRAVA